MTFLEVIDFFYIVVFKKQNKSWRTNWHKLFNFISTSFQTAPVGAHQTIGRKHEIDMKASLYPLIIFGSALLHTGCVLVYPTTFELDPPLSGQVKDSKTGQLIEHVKVTRARVGLSTILTQWAAFNSQGEWVEGSSLQIQQTATRSEANRTGAASLLSPMMPIFPCSFPRHVLLTPVAMWFLTIFRRT